MRRAKKQEKSEAQFIPLKKAREILGCSKGYLTHLCQKGRLKAMKIGKNWMTTQEWVEEYQESTQPRVLSNRARKKEGRGVVLPLYFGWQLKVILERAKAGTKRLFWPFKKHWQEALALILLVVMVASSFFFFQNVKNILGATYTWSQTDWSGGADTVNFPVHPTNQSSWTKYYSKDAEITAGTELNLTPTPSSVTQEYTSMLVFGYNTAEEDASKINDTIVGSKFYCPGGVTTSITTYLDITTGQEQQIKIKTAIYDSDLNKVAESKEKTWSEENYSGWVVFSISVSLPPGDYWLVAFASAAGQEQEAYIRSGSGTNQGFTQSRTYTSGFPASLPPTYNNNKYSIYATFAPNAFGYPTIGTLGTQTIGRGYLDSRITGSVFTSPSNVTADSIMVYINVVYGNYLKAAIYKHSDNSLVGTAEGIFVVSETGWKTLSFTSPPDIIANTEYVLVAWAGGDDGTVSMYYDDGDGTTQGHYQVYNNPVPPFPNPASFTHEDRKYSVYCTYTPPIFISSAIDTGQNSNFTTLDFTINKPPDTDLTFQLRSATTEIGLSTATWYGPTGTGDYYTTSGQTINSVHNGDRWIQYKAYFSRTDSGQNPSLSNITINYTYYPASATLISSPYNTSDTANLLGKIQWTENPPTGTDIKFQLRTAPDNAGVPGTWSNWCGPDNGTTGCSTTTYFTDPAGGETVDADFKDGSNDQWIQYKVWLETTDSSNTPTLSDVTLTYVVNAPPEFDPTYGNNGVSASQEGTDTKVAIDYKIKDIDTTSGTITQNYITPTFKYSLDGGNTWSGTISSSYITFAPAPPGGDITDINSDGKTDNKVLEGSYLIYTAYWDVKSQLGGTIYETDVKIKVTIDDNELANHTATADSATFTLDTKNPLISLNIDARNSVPPTNPATLNITASDDSSLQMMLSNNSDFSADGLNSDSGTWISYATSKSWLLNTEQTTVYLKIRDSYGNQSTTSQVPPRKPINFFWRDISNPEIDFYRIFIAWGIIPVPNPGFKDYKIYYSTTSAETGYSLAKTSTNISENYFIAGAPTNDPPLNNELDPDSTYWFKIYSEDLNDNISQWSVVVPENGDVPDGVGGADILPPAISNVTTSQINTTFAVITWTTDELSNSTVGYSTDQSYSTEVGFSSYVISHSVVLTGLSADTTYNFRVKSTDASNNTSEWATGYSFKTNPGPIISGTTTSTVTNTTATITWLTDLSSTSSVTYSLNSDLSNSSTVSTVTPVTNHSITITGLTQGTTYWYYVESTESNNTATDNNGGNYYSFKTTQDSTPPTITFSRTTDVRNLSSASVDIVFITNEYAIGKINYGTTDSYGSSETESNYNLNHLITLSGLTPGRNYHFQIRATDQNSNYTDTSDYTFTTLEPTDTLSPTISNLSCPVTSVTSSTADISWTTDELANSLVDYGLTTSYGFTQGNSADSETSHSVTLVGLSPSTPYYFQAKSQDAAGNTATSPCATAFTTSEGPPQPPDGDTTPPTITFDSQTGITNITSSSATISWTTDEASDSTIGYSTTQGNFTFEQGTASLVTSHQVTLVNLSQNTTYYFSIKSADQYGNRATKDNNGSGYTFTTPSGADTVAPIISDVSSSNITYKQAVISWRTDEKSNSLVDFGTSLSYGSTQGDFSTYTSSPHLHSVTLVGLSASTIYKFRVRSTDPSSNQAIDDNNGLGYTFTTIAGSDVVYVGGGGGISIDVYPPLLTKVEILNLTQSSATISWETNEGSSSLVTYGWTSAYGFLAGNHQEKVKSHKVILTNLNLGTTYHFQAISYDSAGNRGQSDDLTLTTLGIAEIPQLAEEVAPLREEISQLFGKFSSATIGEAFNEIAERMVSAPLIAGDYPQIEVEATRVRITWLTDKKANSLVAYATEDKYDPTKDEPYSIISGYPDKMVTFHQVEIIGLEPATIYYYQVRSKPLVGPVAKSENLTFRTESLKLEISDITLQIITESEVVVSWQTNLPAATKMEYTNLRTGEKKELEDISYLRDHTISLKNLESNTDYSFFIQARDEAGNEIISPTLTFSTGKDTIPPEISQVRTSAAISPRGDVVQTIIVWQTNEFSSSRVYYLEGVTWREELVKSTFLDKTLVLRHTVVIPVLKSGQVYAFRVESIDPSENIAISKDYTLLTPQQRRTIIQIMISQFEQTFGWIKRLGI